MLGTEECVGLGEAGDGIMAGCRCSLRDRLRSVALVQNAFK